MAHRHWRLPHHVRKRPKHESLVPRKFKQNLGKHSTDDRGAWRLRISLKRKTEKKGVVETIPTVEEYEQADEDGLNKVQMCGCMVCSTGTRSVSGIEVCLCLAILDATTPFIERPEAMNHRDRKGKACLWL